MQSGKELTCLSWRVSSKATWQSAIFRVPGNSMKINLRASCMFIIIIIIQIIIIVLAKTSCHVPSKSFMYVRLT